MRYFAAILLNGLRDYGTAQWEGGESACSHSQKLGGTGTASAKQITSGGTQSYQYKTICPACGARRVDQQIGLEETPQEFVDSLVAVFREVRRVLKPDGVLRLNLGDSYAGSGKGGNPEDSPHSKQATNRGSLMTIGDTARQFAVTNITRRSKEIGLKPKDMIGIPWMTAFALRDDGWYLRSDCIWYKPNPMPGSYTDRPTSAHEHFFLFAKSSIYYFDADAIKEPAKEASIARLRRGVSDNHKLSNGAPGQPPQGRHKARANLRFGGNKADGYGSRAYSGKEWIPSMANGAPGIKDRKHQDGDGEPYVMANKRDVWEVDATGNREREMLAIIESDLRSGEKVEAIKAMMEGYQSDVWRVATKGYRDAHFATYPAELIEPCILSGSRPAGRRCDCDEIIATPTGEGQITDPTMDTGRAGMNRPRRPNEGCRPITRREQRDEAEQIKASIQKDEIRQMCGNAFEHYVRTDASGARPLPETIRQELLARGWITMAMPCACPTSEADVVIDPFAGSGTTGEVANKFGRKAILIELNPSYCDLILKRNAQATLFA